MDAGGNGYSTNEAITAKVSTVNKTLISADTDKIQYLS
jgi:hypothetical protein